MSIDKLARELVSPYYNVGVIDGRTSLGERAKLIRDFQDPSNPLRGLILHPKTAAHGLTLTEASVTIWYGPILSAELYEQANARLWRQGQKETVVIHHLVTKGTMDEQVMKALHGKAADQNALLSAVKARINCAKGGD